MKVHLVVIDPQNDFCDPKGSLFVAGADEDMSRVAKMVKRIGSRLEDIHVTLDSHHIFDVAHPAYWKDSSGKHPNPFTIITAQDVENGVWTPTLPHLMKKAIAYTKALEANGRYPLCIWPPHCLIGSWGYGVVPELFDVLKDWEDEQIAIVDYVTKGSNFNTEHYSAVQADVPDPSDPTTQINTSFIHTLEEADVIVICGEALSHCLANTVRDIANNFSDPSYVKKLVLIKNGSSSVPGFETFGDQFISEMTAKGMQIADTNSFMK